MFSCQGYDSAIFVDRPAALKKIREWTNAAEVEKRVMSVVAPPGGGKTWVLEKLFEGLENSGGHFIARLNVPTLANRGEHQDRNKMIDSSAFADWFEKIQNDARHDYPDIRPVSEIPELSAQIREFVRFLCDCNPAKAPLVIVDGYDEITETQASVVSLRILEPLIEKPCVRMLIAHRPERSIKGDTLRRNNHRTPLYLHKMDPLSSDFAIKQFKALFQRHYPSLQIRDISTWLSNLQHYKWNHPLANCFLFNRGMENGPDQWRALTHQDYYMCCRAIMERPDSAGNPRYPPLTTDEFKILHRIAKELDDKWTQSEVEDLLNLNNFYLDETTGKLFDLGVIFNVSESPPFYQIGEGLRELLREMDINQVQFPE